MNPSIEYFSSSPSCTGAECTESSDDSILSAALEPEFASLKPTAPSRPTSSTNDRTHRVTQFPFSSNNTLQIALGLLHAQHASQSREFIRMTEIARARCAQEDNEKEEQEDANRPSTKAEIQPPAAASPSKSSVSSSSMHASDNKNSSSSCIAADIGGSRRKQKQKRKGHAARCA
uniref:Uncharacterized protein n=1 Tax=Minutocellus polymorphus TaxID=265543 RepID=A0A7S0ALK8_9STRA|mmetsp:Transcript_16657/g.27707  ORF Transcript_16657/g.27707 Transcript_16657/m.27707 type:complete len:175 (+) Transcript_16657:169-693(+)|eukprot:CAMPEP_0197720094 /NCGR_PEP_ID=MMETSP1434-20131217/3564_1 /TAXON_ID=265543 /ORGANISM="Minutocellus polymorphus, Strain CCMP3303" /LENGTH=174 /DNA_ID=CAMNT_0043304897 /DNA_START=166 /DNA_END=690 /DNA_ORIENTATION=-